MISSHSLNGRWPRTTLGSVVTFLDHLRRPVTAKDRQPGPYPYYGANGQQDSVSGYLFDEPLILLAEDGGYFGDPKRPIAYQVAGKCWVNNHAHVLRPSAKVDIRYLCRHLEKYDVRPYTSGTTRLKLNKAKAARIPIALPPLAEQKRIAGILDAADALRAKRREALAQLDTLLQATFLDMFRDPVSNPMGWEIKPLGEICDVRDGTHDSPKYVVSGHPLLTSKNFKDGRIDYSDVNLISDEDFAQINKRSKVDVGDLVMPMIGTIGNPVLVEQEPNFAIKNVALIKFCEKSPDNRFTWALLNSHYFDHITSKTNRGGTQKFVALKDIRSMPIPVPPADLQRRFAAIVESVEQQKALMRAHLTELDALFASLQSRAFNGEL